jgi:SH3-like domain-containing protein
MALGVALGAACATSAALHTRLTAQASDSLLTQPDRWAKKVAAIQQGREYVYDSTANDYFRIVRDNGTQGWIYKDRVTPATIDNAVRIRARLYTVPRKDHTKVLRELSDRIIAQVIERRSGWIRVSIANGEEGWVPREWTDPVRASILASARTAHIRARPDDNARSIGEIRKGESFLPHAKHRLFIEVTAENGVRGWVRNPLYPDSLVIAVAREIPRSQGAVPAGTVPVSVGDIVAPLESVGNQWWIMKKSGHSGFIDKSATGPYFASEAASSAAGDGAPGSGAVGAAGDSVTFPDPRSRDFMLTTRLRCGLVKKPADDADTIEALEAGYEFKPRRVYGVFYEVKGPSGKKGWVNTAFVAANPREPMRVFVDTRMHSTPDSGAESYLGNAWVKKDERVIMSRKEGNWALVTREDGLRGWIYQGTVMPTRRIPGDANIVLYPIFRWFQQVARANSLLGIPIWILFILVFLLPGIIARLLLNLIAYRAFLPNWAVKLGIPAVVIVPVAYLAPHIIKIPPYYNWDIQFFWVPIWVAYAVGVMGFFWKDIGRHRCPSCHAMKAGEMYDGREQTVTTKTTTYYSSGAAISNSSSTTSGTDYMQCCYCGHCWAYSWTDFR